MENMKYRCPACLVEFSQGTSCPSCGFDGKSVDQLPYMQIGALVKDRYRIGRAIHSNEESTTYLAFDREQKCAVHVQEFFPRRLCSRAADGIRLSIPRETEELFLRGVRPFRVLFEKLKLCEGDGILPVQDVFSENKTVYAVMRCGYSGTLEQLIRRRENPLSWNQVSRIFRPVMDTLIMLREHDIRHYGISPESLYLFSDGSMRLGGFGTEAVHRAGNRRPDLYAGYAAPEQYRTDGEITEAADVYALSACMLYAVTGIKPKPADQREADPRLMIPETVTDAIPAFVLSALAGGLQVDPGQRTQTVEQLRAALYTDPQKPMTAGAIPVTAPNEVKAEELKTKMPETTKSAAKKQKKKAKHLHVPNFLSGLIAFLVTAAILAHVCINYIKNDPDYPYIDLDFLGLGGASSSQSSSEEPSSSESSSNASSDTSSVSSAVIPEGTVEVPNYVGKDYDSVVKDKNFTILLGGREFSDEYDEGTVIRQNITGYAKPGSAIAVTVSQGAKERTMPTITGDTLEEARKKLENAGFIVGEVTRERHDGYPDNTVLRLGSSSIKEGKKYAYGTAVDLVISFRG